MIAVLCLFWGTLLGLSISQVSEPIVVVEKECRICTDQSRDTLCRKTKLPPNSYWKVCEK